MKIALCLSGQPRNAIQTSYRIKETIVDGNDVDIFLHCWYDSEDLNFGKRCPGHWGRSCDLDIDKKLLEVYNPKDFIFEKPRHWQNDKMKISEENIKKCFDYGLNDPNGVEAFGKYIVDICHSQWYSKMMVNNIRKKFSVNNNIKYDLILALRYDVSPSIKLNFLNFDSDVFYYQNLNHPLGMISDWFAMGSEKVMDVWGNTYNHIESIYNQLIDQESIFCNELLLRNQLKNNGIKTNPIDIGVSF
ncbi:MAG: hypothetical protein ACO272_01325 [Candidatus Fonsibacter ubiquis]